VLTELNLHLFSRLVRRNQSCKVHLQVLTLAGFLCWWWRWERIGFTTFSSFITRFRRTALRTFSPFEEPLRIHRLSMVMLWETCFCKPAFNAPGPLVIQYDFLSFPPDSRTGFLRFWRFSRLLTAFFVAWLFRTCLQTSSSLLNPCGFNFCWCKDIFKDSICISSSEMSLVPEPVLRLPHQLRILAKPVLLILALTVTFLAVWNLAALVLFLLSYELRKFRFACAFLTFKPEPLSGSRLLLTLSSTSSLGACPKKISSSCPTLAGISFRFRLWERIVIANFPAYHYPVPKNRS